MTITFTVERDRARLGPQIAIHQEVTPAFVHGRWEVRGGGWLGQGSTVDAAIIDWLAYRLGAKT